jgi:REP element-mobilizing transposase RayT
MPNHLHLLITPLGETTLERAMQLIKGGFSYRVKKELGFQWNIWQTSYFDRRVRDRTEYSEFVEYIHHNPVKAQLCSNPLLWPYSSASGKFELDPIPQRLKPSL